MNVADKLKEWKKDIELDISLFKYEFKDNLKSFVVEILQRILAGALVVPAVLYLFLRGCLTVLFIGLGIYLFFWFCILFMKVGIYILGVVAIGWFFITKK